ncbi:Ribonuclease-like 3 [Channa argus]|uniref:Ribonuclease-like 3 n=1 Tax=Channa argus TaxID=215402 RepID=A0A6G1PDX8_CHAAH|nr:Ribonuclease-like 3 [Channa argus]
MKILFAYVLLMLLSATVLSGSNIQPRDTSSATVFPTNETEESIKLSDEESYENFILHHLNKDMIEDKCTLVISKMKMCKKTHTFILADEDDVQKVCNGEGKLNQRDGFTYSNANFNIVDCKLTAEKPNCVYKGELLTNRVVVVKCGGFPVHYERHELNFAE